MHVYTLYKEPEGVGVWHISEGLGSRGNSVSIACCIGDDLCKLPPGYVVIGLEARSDCAGRRGCIAIDQTTARQAPDVLVERIRWWHVRVLDCARFGCSGSSARCL